MRNGRLNRREAQAVERACGIMSDLLGEWDAIAEKNGWEYDEVCEDELYDSASNAVAGLCEFVGHLRRGKGFMDGR